MRAIAAGSLIALAGSTGLALAQPAPAPQEAAATELHRRIRVSVSSDGPPPAADLIRRTMAQGDPATWLSEADVPGAAWSDPAGTTLATLDLDVSTDGQITACKPELYRISPQPAWVAELCAPLTQRAQVIPALTGDGRRLADRLEIRVAFYFSQYEGAEPPPVFMVSAGYSSGEEAHLTNWPPRAGWIDTFARRPTFKQPVEPPGGAALTGPAIGVLVADPKSGDRLECRVVLSSDDRALDDAACDFARTTLQPAWAEAEPVQVRRWPLLLSPQGKGFRAIDPDAGAIRRRQEIEPAELDRLRALWRPDAEGAKQVSLVGQLGPGGRPNSCRIAGSSGSDRADVAACRLFITEARISPPRDIFGQPGELSGAALLDMEP